MLRPRLALFAPVLLLVLGTSGCGIYQNYPTDHDTPWPLVEVQGEGHERPRALVIRPVEGSQAQSLDVLHEEVEASGLFAALQTRATGTQTRPGYDYRLEFELASRDDYSWVAWLGLIPGIPILSEEHYTLTCRVFDHKNELMGEVTHAATVSQALGLILLPFNVLYTILPGSSSPYDVLHFGTRKELMVRALIRDLLREANERFDFSTAAIRKAQAAARAPSFDESLEDLREGRLEEAIQGFAKLIQADNSNPLAWYNLACALALNEQPDRAFKVLEGAVQAGFRDREHALKDKDLASLREQHPEQFAAFLARIDAENAKTKSEAPAPEREPEEEPAPSEAR